MATEYNEVFEDAADSSTVRTIHRVRANSTIMHLNKILGTVAPHSTPPHPAPALSSPVVECKWNADFMVLC